MRQLSSKFKCFPYYDQLLLFEDDTRRKVIVCDCDGILTDGTSTYSRDGKVLKTYGSYDKEMMKWLQEIGFEFIFYTSDNLGLDIHKKRLQDLGVELKAGYVKERIKEIQDIYAADPNAWIVYFGDSISDLEIGEMKEVSFFGVPGNAPDWVRKYVLHHSSNSCSSLADKTHFCLEHGSHGAFAKLCEHVIEDYWNLGFYN